MKKIMQAVNSTAAAVKEATATKEVKAPEVKVEEVKAVEVKAEVKEEVKVENKVPKANVAIIVAKLPDTVTPKQLDALFGLGDGGKTIRRHLRKQFTSKANHEHKADWQWAKNDPVLMEVVAYFAERYTVKEDKKAEAK